jgi:hypothetical protein
VGFFRGGGGAPASRLRTPFSVHSGSGVDEIVWSRGLL